MSFSLKQRTEFGAAVKALRETGAGKEATMYTALRDLFVDILGYPKTSIVVDTAGTRGRPDVTVYAPGGAASSRVSWIVMEAKDEKGAVSTGAKRLKLYAEKAKYITADTAYFVMVDPQRLVARGAGLGRQEDADIEVEWATVTPEAFFQALEPLRAEVAGVPAVMQRFRDGDESLIACDRLSIEESAAAAAILATRVNRNIFFDTLTETTRLLQASTLRASAARVEPAASFSFPAARRSRSPADPAGVAAGLAHGDLDLPDEGQHARVDARAPAARSPRLDAEIVSLIACHDETIGSGFRPRKCFQALIVFGRKNTCCSVETAERATPHLASASHFGIENEGESDLSGATHTSKVPRECRRKAQKPMCRQILTSAASAD